MGREGQADPEHPGDPGVGLCARCAHASRQRSAKGSVFWRCLAAEQDALLLRYPPLPVTECRGFEPATGRRSPGDADRRPDQRRR